jgi:hypothetical protein
MRPLKLKQTVRPTTKQAKNAPCLNEMTSVMQCWKTNDFQDYKCAAEIKAFLLCSEKAMKDTSASSEISGSGSRSWWPHEMVNSNLKKITWNR